MQSIFTNASQAVHFAYTIQAYPVEQGSTLSRVVRQIEQEMSEHPAKTLSGIRFDGMTSMEMHLECCKIRESVRRYLTNIEAGAMEARFATDVMIRSRAIRCMADFMKGLLQCNLEVVLALTHRHYQPVERRDKDWSLRAIGMEYGISKDRAQRMAKSIEHFITELEDQAFDSLAKHFEISKLITCKEYA